jgi:hypothetical protein
LDFVAAAARSPVSLYDKVNFALGKSEAPMNARTIAVPAVFTLLFATTLVGAKEITRRSSDGATQAIAVTQAAGDHPANLVQLMRGVMFPNSNLIFFSGGKDPAEQSPGKRPSAAINPFDGTYGGWQAVENSSLAIVEEANLIAVPGRLCSNGRPVPVNNSDWPALVQGLRDAGMMSYKAAQAKSQDKILDASDALTNACAKCHAKYRDKDNLADRCK